MSKDLWHVRKTKPELTGANSIRSVLDDTLQNEKKSSVLGFGIHLPCKKADIIKSIQDMATADVPQI